MPLLVPGITGNSNALGSGSKEEWLSKLAGKKIGDSHDEVNFARQDLPKEHRIVGPDSMTTMDANPNRLNVHTDKDGTIRDVKFG
ncbi:MAG: hypothetical protein LQ340_003844 [Diploschistes diacapsis]|nr:MAG: hypothetical protein LQ340_003844 [Diploschistes diacapsis]